MDITDEKWWEEEFFLRALWVIPVMIVMLQSYIHLQAIGSMNVDCYDGWCYFLEDNFAFAAYEWLSTLTIKLLLLGIPFVFEMEKKWHFFLVFGVSLMYLVI